MRTFKGEDLIITEKGFKKEEYTSEVDREDNHLSQLKLFISELLFLTHYYTKKTILLYIGSSKDKHINLLPELFPGITIHYYNNKDSDVDESLGITINKRHFNDDNIQEWKDISRREKVLLITNTKDMDLQKKWVEEINPYAYTFRFKLPSYHKDNRYFDYLNGDVYIQPWNGNIYTEHRLEGRRMREGWLIKSWDTKKWKDIYSFYNNNIRNKNIFLNIITKDEESYNTELQNDIESTITVYTLLRYLNRYERISDRMPKKEKIDILNNFFFHIMEKISYNGEFSEESRNRLTIISDDEFTFKGETYNIKEVINCSKKREFICIKNFTEEDRVHSLDNINNKKLRFIIKWYPIGKSKKYDEEQFLGELISRGNMIKYINDRDFSDVKNINYILLDNCDVSEFINYEVDVDFFDRIFNLIRINEFINNDKNAKIIDKFFRRCIKILK